MIALPFSSFVVVKTLCTDTAHTSVKHGSGALIVGIGNCWGLLGEVRCGTTQRLESGRSLLDHVRMDPEQLVAQLTKLRTQNQQLHQALQQVQQQQSQQQGLIQALSDLPQALAQTVGAAVSAAATPARANPTLVDTKGFGKASTAEEHRERVCILGTTYRELRRERTRWSERRLDVGRGKRIGNSDRSERSNGSCDASGHSANAGRSTVHSADDPCGRRIGLWIWRRSGSLSASTPTLGPPDDWKSKRIAQRNPFPWTSCKEQWNDWRT